MLFGEKTMIAKYIVRAVHVIGLMAGLSIILHIPPGRLSCQPFPITRALKPRVSSL